MGEEEEEDRCQTTIQTDEPEEGKKGRRLPRAAAAGSSLWPGKDSLGDTGCFCACSPPACTPRSCCSAVKVELKQRLHTTRSPTFSSAVYSQTDPVLQNSTLEMYSLVRSMLGWVCWWLIYCFPAPYHHSYSSSSSSFLFLFDGGDAKIGLSKKRANLKSPALLAEVNPGRWVMRQIFPHSW